MKILIVNSAEKEFTDFVNPIEEIISEASIESDTIQFSDLSEIDHNNYEGVILSASPKGDDIVDSHLSLYEWIKTYNKPILGICAGHQIMGKLYGSRLMKDVEREEGNLDVKIVHDDPLFEGISTPFLVKQAHNDSVTLPENFVLLASSEKCRNQVMKHNDKPIYTIQFHAEILNKQLILNYLKIVEIFK